MPTRLELIAEPAEAVILSGDPRRTFHLAQELVEEPRMTHLARGLWGYGGKTAGGGNLTVQSTGAGGPGAVAVLSGLVEHGTSRVVRVGSCTAEVSDLALGDSLVVEAALAEDGSSAFFPDRDDEWSLPDRELTEALATAGRLARVASRFRTDPPLREGGPAVSAFDLQTAALLAAAREFGIRAGAVLVVSGTPDGSFATEEELTDPFLAAGRAALRALEAVGGTP